jgi:hypothetical protein
MPTTINKPKTTTTMFNLNNRLNISKQHSRFKVARSIKANGDHDKVIHYLGGVSIETDFEQFFSKQNTTFVRYERDKCDRPKDYCHAWNMVLSPADARYTFHMELTKKTPEQYGYFVNKNFYTEVQKFMQVEEIICKKNYFWIDLCGMPSDSNISEINDFVKSYNSFAEEIYVTFFLNPRAEPDAALAMNRYGKTREDRAKSVCDTLKEKISVDIYSFSVLDVYVNDGAPMAVIKMKKKMKKTKTQNSKTKNPICNSENYALMRDKGFTNLEIQTMWGVPQMAVAAYQAWNTMGGKTWNDQQRDIILPNVDYRQVCKNTITLDDEHDPENGMI